MGQLYTIPYQDMVTQARNRAVVQSLLKLSIRNLYNEVQLFLVRKIMIKLGWELQVHLAGSSLMLGFLMALSISVITSSLTSTSS